MKRLLTLLFLFLFLPIMPVHATGSLYGVAFFGKPFSTERVRDYMMLKEASMHYEFVALALASDNAYGGGQDANLMDAKAEAIRGCQRASIRPDTCEIVDVNGESGFIKKRKDDTSALKDDTSALKEKLLELKELVDEGLITEEDYEKAKNELLEKI